ncbi:MAG TPA: caspase family protein [Dissulfurispiraceae bacterium]|nr:caspase family protein [Dissulfurispiraceae bacterium]
MRVHSNGVVSLSLAVLLLAGCVGGGTKMGDMYSRPALVNLEPINVAVSVKPTSVLPHLKNKIDQEKLDAITTMLYEMMKTEAGFQPVAISGDQYEYAVVGTVVDLSDLFNNIIHLQLDIQDKSAGKNIYSTLFVGYNLTQNSSISRITDMLRGKLNEIRSIVSADSKARKTQFARPAVIRQPASSAGEEQSPEDGKENQNTPHGVNFGRYYALVIGNNNYEHLSGLVTAHQDAQDLAALLEKNYGFSVKLLLDAKRADIITTLAGYREKLGWRDNLLIYYAGHGWLDKDGDEGYWLPVDATRNDELNWVSNASITTALKAIEAKHVLVVADSCYSGKLVRGLHITQRTPDYYSKIAQKRARLVIASGGLEPVADSGGKGNHSVFASAFLSALTENQGIIDGSELFNRIRRPVMLGSDQTPEYADIRKAGHDGGDFIFVRQK